MNAPRLIWWWRVNRVAVFEGVAGVGWAVWMGYLGFRWWMGS